MYVTATPEALPGTCIRCPGSSRKLYVDLDLHIEFHGAVFLCDECIAEMGRMLGMITKDQADALIQSISDKDSELFDLKRRVSGLEAAVRGLADAGFEPIPQRGDSGILSPYVEGQGNLLEGSGGNSSSGADRLGTGEGTPLQPGNDEQLDGVHTNDGGNGGDFRLSL